MTDCTTSPTDIFAKFERLTDRIDALCAGGRRPFGMQWDAILSPTRGVMAGQEILLLGTNNYLGLTFDGSARDAAKAAIDRFGTATTGSRLANGTFAEHTELEAALRAFFGMPAGIVFTTGYQANLAAISALAGRGDHILIDADSHACIYDGCRLSDAETHRFRHNSPADLAKRLARLPAEGARLVVIEGLYSMLGDVAPVAEFVEVAHAHGALLYVDEAHSFGCYGETGRGVSGHLLEKPRLDRGLLRLAARGLRTHPPRKPPLPLHRVRHALQRRRCPCRARHHRGRRAARTQALGTCPPASRRPDRAGLPAPFPGGAHPCRVPPRSRTGHRRMERADGCGRLRQPHDPPGHAAGALAPAPQRLGRPFRG